MRVLAALSGGVDSAVAAARAVDAGHDVVGVHMALSRTRDQFRTGSRGCCSIEDAGDARRAADVLGIPYYVWDLSERFEETVVADFVAEYEAGRTPNPCVRCNEHIKFATLLDKAVALGFDAVCTGHYARIETRADGTRELHRARDLAKDQSYVLAVMGPERLARSMFPLGDVASKEETRAEAAARGLSVSAKPDSYDICFVADGDTQGFLRSRLGSQPGRDRRRLRRGARAARRRVRVHRRAAQGPVDRPARPRRQAAVRAVGRAGEQPGRRRALPTSSPCRPSRRTAPSGSPTADGTFACSAAGPRARCRGTRAGHGARRDRRDRARLVG